LAATDFLNKDVFMPVNEELAKKLDDYRQKQTDFVMDNRKLTI